MALYTTVAKVRENMPSWVSSITQVTSAYIASVIAQVDGQINAQVATYYTVPVSSCPALELIATDLSAYRVLRRQFTQEKKNSSDWVDQFKASEELLKQIGKGKATLTNSAGVVIAKNSGNMITSNNIGYTQTFNEDSFEDAVIDPNKLQDIADSRDF